ncbi:hypothetical protein QBC40DRAFT_255324 [Triangularia verruculosa]|uniref:Uncharacterized protein n=1 Tax=Triangularia verruculosa TaxID=2587418 RepID=A0AAN6XES4_9PEZI|nr:hypothetical protein QBC40DRAFT_255324 [Triangularia verruculosa]
MASLPTSADAMLRSRCLCEDTFAGLVTFAILSFFNRDIFWFILYWLQVPVLGLNGPRIGWLYVPPRGHWDNEVNTRRWRCTFYVFTDNNHWLNLLKRAFLLYSVVYFVTFFLVPDQVIYHPFMMLIYNIRDLGLPLAKIFAIFRIVRNWGRRFLQTVQATWSHLHNQSGFLFGKVWRKRHLYCIGLVLLLASWSHPSSILSVNSPKNGCETVSDLYKPGFFLSFAGSLYRLGDFAKDWASRCSDRI